MKQTFEIPGRFMSFNDFTRLEKIQRNREEQDAVNRVFWAAKAARIRPYRVPIRYHTLWIEQNHRRDLDNVAFAKKFIQDGLVRAGVLHNDTHHEIVGFSDEFDYDSRNPRIIVTLEEVVRNEAV